MENKYFIGIDFGHGETTVSRVPGYNGVPVSQIPLRLANNEEEKKVISAVCRDHGEWSLVFGEDDFKSSDLRQGFKMRVSQMNYVDRESMRAFAQLIFQTILENDSDLVYNSADEKNFELGIACPSDWVREEPNAQQEYLDFFKNECGLPVDHCIKESDAAFFTKFETYFKDHDDVFVIDLGSSTIDFTTYSNSKCISECCWGRDLGAHQIEDTLLPLILKEGPNGDNLKKLIVRREAQGVKGTVDQMISLFIRSEKERFFSNKQKTFLLTLPFSRMGPAWEGNAWDICIGYNVSAEAFYSIISSYMEKVKEELFIAKGKLQQHGISPNRVLISGGASRMSFVKDCVKNIFDVDPDVDQQPECVVSNGIALYAQKYDEAFDALFEKLGEVNFGNIYREADTEATTDAIKELIPAVVSRIINYSGCTGERMRTFFCDFIRNLNESNATFKNLVITKLRRSLNEAAAKAISDAYKQVFSITVDTSNIDLQIEANILAFSDQNFQPGGGWYNSFTAWIDSASGRFDFTWDKPRDSSERERIAKGVQGSLFASLSSDFITYGDLSPIVERIVKQVAFYSAAIFQENQLFETTYKQ